MSTWEEMNEGKNHPTVKGLQRIFFIHIRGADYELTALEEEVSSQ